jgi:hypothetical protein
MSDSVAGDARRVRSPLKKSCLRIGWLMIHQKVRDTTDYQTAAAAGPLVPGPTIAVLETRYSTAAPNCYNFQLLLFQDRNALTTVSSYNPSHSFLHSSNRRSFDLLTTSAKPLHSHRLVDLTAPHFSTSWQRPPTALSRPPPLNPTMLLFTSQGDGKQSPGLRSLTILSPSPIVRLACLRSFL